MDKSLHVLIIPSWYPINENDIHGSFFREQANALGVKHKVGLIYPYFISLNKVQSYNHICKNLISDKDDNIIFKRKVHLNYFPKLKSIFLKNWVNKGLKLFREYIKENGCPDIIQVHSMLPAGLLALKIKQIYNIPYIITEHSSRYFFVEKNIGKDFDRIMSSADYLSSVSGSYSEYLSLKTRKHWGVLPNFINESFFEEELCINKNNIVFSTISFLNKNKNTILFLKAIQHLKKQLPSIDFDNIKFIIAGDGPELNTLIQYAENNKLNKNIFFTGGLSRSQVIKTIGSSDAIILCSNFESFSVICAEANAMGKPVISTKCGGPEYFLNHENSFLIEKNDYMQLSVSMLKIIENRNLFDHYKIRENCRKKFSQKSVISELTRVFYNIVIKDEH